MCDLFQIIPKLSPYFYLHFVECEESPSSLRLSDAWTFTLCDTACGTRWIAARRPLSLRSGTGASLGPSGPETPRSRALGQCRLWSTSKVDAAILSLRAWSRHEVPRCQTIPLHSGWAGRASTAPLATTCPARSTAPGDHQAQRQHFQRRAHRSRRRSGRRQARTDFVHRAGHCHSNDRDWG